VFDISGFCVKKNRVKAVPLRAVDRGIQGGPLRIPNTTGSTVLEEITINASKGKEQLLLGAGKFPRIDYKFGKHAKEWSQWGSISKKAYYNRAVRLSENTIGGEIMGFTSPQGWNFRFNSATGEFLTTHPTGYIETFYRPTTGMNYYLNQISKYGN